EKIGSQPSTAWIAGSASSRSQGTTTSRAQAPKTMVGTPAATSITAPITAASRLGAYSTIRIVIATETGTARRRASAVVRKVPTMNGSAPYTSPVEFHTLPVKKPNPLAVIDGQAVPQRTNTIRPKTATITTAAASEIP